MNSTLKLALALIFTSSISFDLATAQQTTCKPSPEAALSVKVGMDYSQVAKILGCEGDQKSKAQFGSNTSAMYQWTLDGGMGSNLVVMLMNEKVQGRTMMHTAAP